MGIISSKKKSINKIIFKKIKINLHTSSIGSSMGSSIWSSLSKIGVENESFILCLNIVYIVTVIKIPIVIDAKIDPIIINVIFEYNSFGCIKLSNG